MVLPMIETQCRLICNSNKIDPDALAPDPFQKVPGFKRDDFGKVRMWQTWITTVTAERDVLSDIFTKQRAESRQTLNRIIQETSQ